MQQLLAASRCCGSLAWCWSLKIKQQHKPSAACCMLLLRQVSDEAKSPELASLFGLTADDIAEVSSAADKAAEKHKEEEEAFFL